MQNLRLIIFFVCLSKAGISQNILLNGNFELFSGCPNYLDQFDSLMYWKNPALWPGQGGTPDYYNQCASPAWVGTPLNFNGYQNAHSGVGYAGMLTYYPMPGGYREYIEGTLNTSLLSNTCYYFEMYINLAERGRYTSGNIGVYFSDTLVSGINNAHPIALIPQITNNTGMEPDTSTWKLFSGVYNAHGGENYLIIGNFDNDLSTSINFVNSASSFDCVYLFIDDVSLSACTAIEEVKSVTYLRIYPNIFRDHINIYVDSPMMINIYDVSGRKIKSEYVQANTILDLEKIPTGIYFYQAVGIYGNYSGRILKL